MRRVLRGIDVPPVAVGVARGALEAAVFAALGVVAVAITDLDLGSYAWLAPLLVFGLRVLEGWADHIDPEKRSQQD
jgi:hypothetical protein